MPGRSAWLGRTRVRGLERSVGHGTQARALSRARHVPFEVPTRMTCMTRTRADGSERTYITEAETTHQRGRDLMAKTKERTDKRVGGKHPGGRAGERTDRNGAGPRSEEHTSELQSP